ncbi:MAG: ATP-dependent zinc metalloprotease FtsH [Lachnospiraceae bacterium]|nr:ATP-dependent zinc metalloprotease FtsH [Lachnospiraceae bacterium]
MNQDEKKPGRKKDPDKKPASEHKKPVRPSSDNGKTPGNPEPLKKMQLMQIVIMAISVLIIVLVYFGGTSNGSRGELPYNQFITMVEEGKVTEVTLQEEKIRFVAERIDQSEAETEAATDPVTNIAQQLEQPETEPVTEAEPVTEPAAETAEKPVNLTVYETKLVGDENSLVELLHGRNITFQKKEPSALTEVLSLILNIAVPLVIFMVGMMFIMKRAGGKGGVMGVGKSKAKTYIQQDTGVTFKDVAGEDEAKESLQEVVGFLHEPEKYTEIGAKLPKGVLLVGPPGTGKTLLAKAVAGEAHAPFFSLSGSEFVEMFVGVGASRVRDLFEEAKKNAPCIIFIDEIDAIGKTRDNHYGGNDEREQTLNQLLAEMDGFDSSKGILILAATNRPEILDPALLRPGRFDRRVIVDRPDLRGRVNILKVHADKVQLDETVDLEEIALATSGAVGSDLANMVNEAAILAVKNGRNAVSQKDLFEAVEVVLVGKEKKDRILSQEERRIVSYHEVGHALISALQKDAEPVQKITIIPRTMGALGYVMQVPEEEKYLNSKNELDAMVIGLLAGRAAEELVFNSITTGAANDIERATKIVRAMITQYGMSDAFGLMGLAQQQDKYLGGRVVLNCGDATATEIDHEVMRVLKEAYAKALEMLAGNRDVLDRIAEFLIQKETITGKEFMELYHQVLEERKRTEDPEYYFDTEDAEYTEE